MKACSEKRGLSPIVTIVIPAQKGLGLVATGEKITVTGHLAANDDEWSNAA